MVLKTFILTIHINYYLKNRFEVQKIKSALRVENFVPYFCLSKFISSVRTYNFFPQLSASDLGFCTVLTERNFSVTKQFQLLLGLLTKQCPTGYKKFCTPNSLINWDFYPFCQSKNLRTVGGVLKESLWSGTDLCALCLFHFLAVLLWAIT